MGGLTCVDESRKHDYIHQYYDKEGILLDYSTVEENPASRPLANIVLNSFWGKFVQRSNLTQTTYTDDPEQCLDMLTSDQQVV